MIHRSAHISFVVLTAAAFTICAGCRTIDLKEVQHVRSGDLDIVLLSPDGALHQKDPFTIEFRSASAGKLTNVGTVHASASMLMRGMAPMLGNLDVAGTDTPGRYTVRGTLDMTGGWRITLDWDGPAGKGSVNVQGTIQ